MKTHLQNPFRPLVAGIAMLALAMTSPSIAQSPGPAQAAPVPDFANLVPAQVIRVTDTCEVRVSLDGGERSFALAGVAAPRVDSDRKVFERFLVNLLQGEAVYLLDISSNGSQDASTSRAAMIYRAPDGLFVNLEAIRQGYAVAQIDPASPQAESFNAHELRARKAGKGVWEPRRSEAAAVAREAEAPKPAAQAGSVIVYVTKSGTKYHCEGCQYLSKSSTAIPLEDAVKRYEPCSRCKPPKIADD